MRHLIANELYLKTHILTFKIVMVFYRVCGSWFVPKNKEHHLQVIFKLLIKKRCLSSFSLA